MIPIQPKSNGFISKWIRKLFLEVIEEYYRNRPMDVIHANRDPSDLDYHFYPGTKWKNARSNEVHVLKNIHAEWKKLEETNKKGIT